MATLGDDCYFYYTSSCAKGPTCTFRHVEAAKTCQVVCQHWQMGRCFRPMCKFRHSDFPIQDATPCYWETQPVGCTKKVCPYKHSKPRNLDDNITAAATTVATTTVVTTPSTDASSSQTKPIDTEASKGLSEMSTQNPAIKIATSAANEKQSEVKASEDNESSNKENGSKTTPDGTITKEKTETKETTDPKTGVKKKTRIVKRTIVRRIKRKVPKKGTNASAANDGVIISEETVVREEPKKPVKTEQAVTTSSPRKRASPPPAQKDDSGSGSGSDDSVDNIKVLSMEEILRQKALESMMKKRGLETKPAEVAKPKPTLKKEIPKRSGPQSKIVLKKRPEPAPAPLRRKKITPVTAPESSDESSSSSDSSSSSSSEEDSSDSEQERRRVVVEVDEKAARNRAKQSLLKKQAAIKTTGKDRHAVTKLHSNKRMVNVDYDSDDIISSRLKPPVSVKDRLGKHPTALSHSASASRLVEERRAASASPRKTVLRGASSGDDGSSSEEEEDVVGGIKVKTLEEIRREKMAKSDARLQESEDERVLEGDSESVPMHQRLGPGSPHKQEEEEDDSGSRKILVANEPGSKSDGDKKQEEVNKKGKRRPWRTKTQRVVVDEKADKTGDDERTTVVVSSRVATPPPASDQLEEDVEESPFERLKRRALMKKMENLQKSKEGLPVRNIVQESKADEDIKDDKEGDTKTVVEKVEEESSSSSHKKHKHKHKHKHHKKSKKERQIYVPPAMKSTEDNTISRSPPQASSVKLSTTPQSPPGGALVKHAATKHPIAAAWAAGLNRSGKGTSTRRPLDSVSTIPPLGVGSVTSMTSQPPQSRLGSRPAELGIAKSLTSSQLTSESKGEVTIKSFSEIMAEKRRRRLELQGKTQLPEAPSSQSSLPSLPPPVTVRPFTRVPISPIVFSADPLSRQRLALEKADSIFSSSSSSVPKAQSSSSLNPPASQEISFIPSSSTTISRPGSGSQSSAVPEESPTKRLKAAAAKPDPASSSPLICKKASGQKKLFKKKKSVEQVSQPADDNTLASMGISIPLPPMTLEEELELDERSPPQPTSQEYFESNVSHKNSEVPSPSSTLQLESTKLSPQSTPSTMRLESASFSPQPTKANSSFTSPPPVAEPLTTPQKHKLHPSTQSTETSPTKKSRLSLSIDDELALFDDDMEQLGDNTDLATGDVLEPIDDLLQDIDDLLA